MNGRHEVIRIGPVASLVSIMQLGTNGGGYYGANSANPFQNPNPATDIFEIFLMLLLPTTLCFVYGAGAREEARDQAAADRRLPPLRHRPGDRFHSQHRARARHRDEVRRASSRRSGRSSLPR